MSAPKVKPRLGELLVDGRVITPEQLEIALEEQRISNRPLGTVLYELGFIKDEEVILDILSRYYGVRKVDLAKFPIDVEAVKLLTPEIARKHLVMPISRRGNKLVLAMADPGNIVAIDDVRSATGMDVEPVVVSYAVLSQLISRYYPLSSEIATAVTEDLETLAEVPVVDVTKEAREAPTVRLLNNLLLRAVERHASDIHIEPQRDKVLVRMRIDGVLHTVAELPKGVEASLIGRIKVLSQMNVAERRLPQDGHFRFRVKERQHHVRVATSPTVHGEKAVLRFLRPEEELFSLELLGMTQQQLNVYLNLLRHPHGIILVVGPTGSGKTTTLYASVIWLNDGRKNIVTLEEPVEQEIPGISQIQMHPEIGLTFASALRNVLRQDPDIILVGEIRDTETAELAIRAAMTGHLVLSTLHANTAAAAIPRMRDLGVQAFLLASSLLGVVSQRLVRLNCPRCSQPYTPHDAELKALGLTLAEASKFNFMRGQGCAYCDMTGYYGRTALFEILPVTSTIRTLIMRDAPEGEIESAAVSEGMMTLRESCFRLLAEGRTTVEEVFAVLAVPEEEKRRCKRCGYPILERDFIYCPKCHLQLMNVCSRCERKLSVDWDVCPYCGSGIEPMHERLFEEVDKRLQQLDRLYKVGLAVTSEVDINVILNMVMNAAITLIGADSGSIMLLDEATGTLRIATHRGLDEDIVASTSLKLGEGIAGKVAKEGRAIIVTPTRVDPDIKGLLHREQIVSSIAVPLQARGKVLGVLCINSLSTEKMFDEEDLKLAFALASYAAIAIDNSKLYAVSGQEQLEKVVTTIVSQNEQRLIGRRGHAARVSRLCKQLLIELGYDASYAQRFSMAVLGHEIGLITVPDTVLNKQGKLTKAERQLLERFPIYSEQFIKLIPQLSEFAPAIRHHAERLDGSGYPDRLVGGQIPRLAMVIAVCDVYDALVCPRPHRPAFNHDEALAQLKEQAGKQLDAEIVKAFISMVMKHPVESIIPSIVSGFVEV
ncbi:MAG: ATPase, T2SS/T4P/T4SS family [Armatimonadota bacterium]|nr:ATPase, T2SS/T4P/T4SS family [Armatimonadota bacterium]MCX7777967.1 ATPase, T2SS/T4P/T4SS family [Armatimonadota bacterium]MDW8025276.1 ATPase, T2SS/T4P/T4SS family [Armatimonadota bacterium]